MPRDAHLAVKVFTKFEVDTTIRCLVIALIAADTLHDLVTLTFDLSRVMSSDISHDTIDNASAATAHAPYHVTYAQGATSSHIFEIPDPDLPLHCTTFMALRLKQMELSAKTVYGPVLKITQRSAPAFNLAVNLLPPSFRL